MKTYLINHNPLWSIFIWASPADISFLKKIYRISPSYNPAKEKKFPLILGDTRNRQINRLQVATKFMIRDKNFIITHWILCLINDKIVLIWWISHSGKTFLYNYLYKQGYVSKLYDEDLCCLFIYKNQAFSLSDFSFMGQRWSKYIYKKNIDNIYGIVDYIFLLDPTKEDIKKIELTWKAIEKYLLHETLDNHKSFYIKSPLKYKVSTYIIGNNYHQSKNIHIKNAAFILKKTKCAK